MLLQGLLLKSPEYWPPHLSSCFGTITLDGSIIYIKMEYPHWRVLLASFVNVRVLKQFFLEWFRGHELAEVLESWRQPNGSVEANPEKWAWENVMDIDPRRWPPR